MSTSTRLNNKIKKLRVYARDLMSTNIGNYKSIQAPRCLHGIPVATEPNPTILCGVQIEL